MADAPVSGPEVALVDLVRQLGRLGKRYALVGGLAVSVRAEVRFTRDVDVVVSVESDAETEALVRELRVARYRPVVIVEHEARRRLATVRLDSPSGFVVDLIAASSGIEAEIIERATPVRVGDIDALPVARAEELLAMKVLSMTPRRLQDRIDAVNLILFNEALRLDDVRADLELIVARGYNRDQDLVSKLQEVIDAARSEVAPDAEPPV